MNKIKVRAWDEKRKRLFEVHSAYIPEGVERNEFFIGFNSNGLEVSEYEGKDGWRIFPTMQFTGVKDRNGKDIYEGDIIIFGNGKNDNGEVELDYGGYIISGFGFLHRLGYPEIVGAIVGNVYEDATLIE